jgi:hypothetical protein
MRAILCAASLCLATACGFTREPTAIENLEPQFGVFSLVRAGSDTVSVLVVRFPASGEVQGVPGATVRFIASGDTVVLTEEPTSSTACVGDSFDGTPRNIGGCYRAAVVGQVQVGAVYGLVADVPGFGRVVGSTRIPAPPVVAEPTEGSRFAASFRNGSWPTMPVRVEAPVGTARIEVTLIPNDSMRRCEAYFIDYSGGAFGIMAVDPEAGETLAARFLANCFTPNSGPQPLGELPALFRATTFDSTYARFAEIAFDRQSGSMLLRNARAGIDRGVGYFAGAATAEVRIILTGSGP